MATAMLRFQSPTAKDPRTIARGSSRSRGGLTPSLAKVGRDVLLAAFTGLRTRDELAVPDLPECLRRCPRGEQDVPIPQSDDAWDEVVRDLARSLNGGTVFVAGQQRLYPLRGTDASPGAVGSEASREAVETISEAISREMAAQGGIAKTNKEMQPAVLQKLVMLVAAHVSVTPGVDLVMSRGLPPNLWQPIFTICIGDGQVRILTFAFIGEPVTGDRPDRKRTPFCLQIATNDLVRVAEATVRGEPEASQAARVWYSAEAVSESILNTLDFVVSIEDRLFKTIEQGTWEPFLRGVREDDEAASVPDESAALATPLVAATHLIPQQRDPAAAMQRREQLTMPAVTLPGFTRTPPQAEVFPRAQATKFIPVKWAKQPKYSFSPSPIRFTPFKSCSGVPTRSETLIFVDGATGI